MNLDAGAIFSFIPIPVGTVVLATFPDGEKWLYPVIGYAVVVDDWTAEPGRKSTHLEPVVVDEGECVIRPMSEVGSNDWRIVHPGGPAEPLAA